MKRIITSLGVIVFVAALVAGGTGAFFNDTETSTGNIFTAGAIDLKVDSVAHINGLVCFDGAWHPESIVSWDEEDKELVLNEGVNVPLAIETYNLQFPANVPQAGDDCAGTWTETDLGPSNVFFDYSDLKPGDSGENTISLHVYDNDAYMCATIGNVADLDNGQTEPELEDGDDAGPAGELDSELSFVVWEEADGNNIYERGETILVENSDGQGIAGTYDLYSPAADRILKATTTTYLGVYWCYGDITIDDTDISCSGEEVDNISQTDSLKADITFYLEQARHNEDFTCGDDEPEEPTPITRLTLEKSLNQDLIDPVAETLWTLTASGTTAGTGVISGTESSPEVSSAVVVAGSYALSESAIAGFTLTSIVCGGTGVTFDDVTDTVTIPEGSNAVCTFTNTENTIQQP
jgi:predicted ribosomally synthesized peptide with SipW-like signal peptide